MENYLVLYNPYADNKHGKENAEKLKDTLKEASLEFVDITTIEDLEAYIKEIPEEKKLLLTGGDGTLNRFVNNVNTDEMMRSAGTSTTAPREAATIS